MVTMAVMEWVIMAMSSTDIGVYWKTGKKKISSENEMKKYASLKELLPKQNKIVFPSIFAELEIKLTDTCYLKLVT